MSASTTGMIRWDHLIGLTGPLGLFEHALYDVPRPAHGYATDDNGRALVVIARASPEGVDPTPYLRHVVEAFDGHRFRLRRRIDGSWVPKDSDDATGRALWGLGEWIGAGRATADLFQIFEQGIRFRTDHPRAIAYTLLGVVAAARQGEVAWDPAVLRKLPRARSGRWAWPAPRLTYANARIPEALIRAGALAGDDRAVADGLRLLEWLVGEETADDHFSFTSVDGRGPGDPRPAFDQQPIEAWSMADACHAAWKVDGGDHWREAMVMAGEWVLGRNDSGLSLYDAATGAGYDGLGPGRVNMNCGAESTLAALAAIWRLEEDGSIEPGAFRSLPTSRRRAG